MGYYYNQNKNNECAFCGANSYLYELCSECYNLSKEEIIVKNENGKWIKNIKKGNEYKFYDENKNYYLKEPLLNEYEMDFFNVISSSLKSKYDIVPQVNLQTIIETNSNKRNDELFRNVDFAIFNAENYTPFLIIELNGQQHYTNEYWKERDKSIKSILNKVGLPLLTIDIKDFKEMKYNDIVKLINKTIKYVNPSSFSKFKNKNYNKLDLSWTKEFIKQSIKNK